MELQFSKMKSDFIPKPKMVKKIDEFAINISQKEQSCANVSFFRLKADTPYMLIFKMNSSDTIYSEITHTLCTYLRNTFAQHCSSLKKVCLRVCKIWDPSIKHVISR